MLEGLAVRGSPMVYVKHCTWLKMLDIESRDGLAAAEAAALSAPSGCLSHGHGVHDYAELCGLLQMAQIDFDVEPDLSISLKHMKCREAVAET